MGEHLIKNHVSVIDFAVIKEVYPQQVYTAIEKGLIDPDFIGKAETKMIDLEKYKDFEFSKRKNNSIKKSKWYQNKSHE